MELFWIFLTNHIISKINWVFPSKDMQGKRRITERHFPPSCIAKYKFIRLSLSRSTFCRKSIWSVIYVWNLKKYLEDKNSNNMFKTWWKIAFPFITFVNLNDLHDKDFSWLIFRVLSDQKMTLFLIIAIWNHSVTL